MNFHMNNSERHMMLLHTAVNSKEDGWGYNWHTGKMQQPVEELKLFSGWYLHLVPWC